MMLVMVGMLIDDGYDDNKIYLDNDNDIYLYVDIVDDNVLVIWFTLL